MGKVWDGGDISFRPDVWLEVFRVLKPGGHLLSFGGTRTYHRITCAIEDAGFEIRDQIAWVYGQGFPKSHDVSKGIDRTAGAKRKVVKTVPGRMPQAQATGWGNPGVDTFRDERRGTVDMDVTAPATDAAKQWEGWGTALKPAMEPICVARKPLDGTVAENVLKHGTGAINIDGCRVGTEQRTYSGSGAQPNKIDNHGRGDTGLGLMDGRGKDLEFSVNGRWPANLIHDGSEEVLEGFPNTGNSGVAVQRHGGGQKIGGKGIYGGSKGLTRENTGFLDGGSAARFFYCAKASRSERGEGNGHPTVKPIALVAYLCRLVTPPKGIVLDPFMGSGTTGIAALKEGFDFIGIEKEEEYYKIAESRIQATKKSDTLASLFGE